MFSTSRFLSLPAALAISASVAVLSGSVSPAQEAPAAPAPTAPAPPRRLTNPPKAGSGPGRCSAPSPAGGAPSAVEAAKTGWDGAPALPSANLPASIGPRPAGSKTESEGTAKEAPGAPAMPDPLVSPLEEPPVPTDLVSGGAEPTPTESVVVNLINRLVERGVLTQGDAAELVSQAQRDAAVASQNAAAAALVAADAAMASEEDIVVTHIPEPVKDRLREEIREEILAELPEVKDTHFELAEGGKEAVMGGSSRLPRGRRRPVSSVMSASVTMRPVFPERTTTPAPSRTSTGSTRANPSMSPASSSRPSSTSMRTANVSVSAPAPGSNGISTTDSWSASASPPATTPAPSA